jgi:hypothetical protein
MTIWTSFINKIFSWYILFTILYQSISCIAWRMFPMIVVDYIIFLPIAILHGNNFFRHRENIANIQA